MNKYIIILTIILFASESFSAQLYEGPVQWRIVPSGQQWSGHGTAILDLCGNSVSYTPFYSDGLQNDTNRYYPQLKLISSGQYVDVGGVDGYATGTSAPSPVIYHHQCVTCPQGTTWNDNQGKCVDICTSPAVWDQIQNRCVTPCPSGELKVWDPERCICQEPNVRLDNGSCGPRPNCDDFEQRAIDKCKEISLVKSGSCDVQDTVNQSGEHVLKKVETPIVCDCTHGQVWVEETGLCENPNCGDGRYFDNSIEKCVDKAKDPPPEEKKCADGSKMPDNGKCPETDKPGPEYCQDGTVKPENGKCPEKDKECPQGQHLSRTGNCEWDEQPGTQTGDDPKQKEAGEKEGQKKFFASGSAKIRIPVKRWGVDKPGEYNMEPLTNAINIFKDTPFVTSVKRIPMLYGMLSASGQAPVFDLPLGNYNMHIDLQMYDLIAAMFRFFFKIIMLLSLIFLVLKQWRLK